MHYVRQQQAYGLGHAVFALGILWLAIRFCVAELCVILCEKEGAMPVTIKVGIVTLIGWENYGNRLQNYATQEILQELGCKVETLVYLPVVKGTSIDYLHKLQKMTFSGLLLTITTRIKRVIQPNARDLKLSELLRIRHRALRIFCEQYIAETGTMRGQDSLPKTLGEHYDKFVVGSDQVWSPHGAQRSPFFFLAFAPVKKRIAYAASFGVSRLPKECESEYKDWITEMAHVSVREDDGAHIVKSITGRDVPVLVDPTLMLTKEQWLAIARPARNKPATPYILTYFLGEMPDILRRQIDDAALRHHLCVVHLNSVEDETNYTVGPGEFVDYMSSASYILTDSYHGAIFSMIFSKSFAVYERSGGEYSMFSRINTLLSKFKLESCRRDTVNDGMNLCNIDYTHVPPLLSAERTKAINYLKEALFDKT